MITKFEVMPFYPANLPIYWDVLMYEGERVKDIVLRYWRGQATKKDKAYLKEYAIYYLKAPVFILTQPVKPLEDMELMELLNYADEHLLDIF